MRWGMGRASSVPAVQTPEWAMVLTLSLPPLQVVHPRYAEAMRIGAAALSLEAGAPTLAPPILPHLFGSPEYLQVSFAAQ